MFNLKNKDGSSLIEVLVALSSAAVVVTAVLSLTIASHRLNTLSRSKTKAIDLATDSLEIAYFVRNESWTDLQDLVSETNRYYPKQESGNWVFAINEENIDQFTRYVEIKNVYRDDTGNISDSGTNLDEDMIKVRGVVKWQERGIDNIVELSTVVSNID